MGQYSVIAEVGEALTDLLKKGLVPELLPDVSQIGLCSPDERGDYIVGLYLYNIQLNDSYRVTGMQNRGLREQSFPPIDLTLSYMVIVRSASDIQHRSAAEHRMLGRIIQIFHDNNTLRAEEFGSPTAPDMRIEMIHPSREEMKSVWTNEKEQFRTSLFYTVAPVEIESERTRRVGRVTDVEIRLEEQEKRR